MVMRSVRWLHTSAEEPFRFRLGRAGQDVVAQWDGLATLWAARDASRHRVDLPPEISDEYRDKFNAGPVRALLRHLLGGMTLHGSSIALGGGSIIFLGPSGSGKSTTAAYCCGQLGGTLLADDLVAVDPFQGGHQVPRTETTHWLLPDSLHALGLGSGATTKMPVRAREGDEAIAPLPLRAIVVLAFQETAAQPSLTPVEGAAAFEAINANYVRFVIDEPAVVLQDFEQIANVCGSVPTFVLSRRPDLAHLQSAARVLLETIGNL